MTDSKNNEGAGADVPYDEREDVMSSSTRQLPNNPNSNPNSNSSTMEKLEEVCVDDCA